MDKLPAGLNRLPPTDADEPPSPEYSRLRELEERFVASLGEIRGRWRAPARLHERVRRALEVERQRSRRR